MKYIFAGSNRTGKVILSLFMTIAFALAVYADPMQNYFPEKIKTVAIVAPASPPTSLENLDRAVEMLKKAGYKVKEMPHVRVGAPVKGYRSISAKKRKADLEAAWLDPEVDLIWCVRGGINSRQLLPILDWEKLSTRPDMPVLGFSDITSLHCGMLKKKIGHPIAAPSLSSFLNTNQECIDFSRQILAGEQPAPVKLEVLKSGNARGLALAGHLMLLHQAMKTEFVPDTNGKILFMECPGFGAKKILAALNEMNDSGFFQNCAAIVLGSFKGAKKREKEVISKLADMVTCPVFAGYPYGHTPQNSAIDMRRQVSVSADGILTWL